MSADSILLTGSSGFIGNSLVRTQQQNRISTIGLHRHLSTGDEGLWDPHAANPVHRPETLGLRAVLS
jgi:nucleoside-diphosphate-sugar epimerase